MAEWMPFLMFVFVIAILMAGFPVAFGLAGGALLFAAVGYAAGLFDSSFLGAIPAHIRNYDQRDVARRAVVCFYGRGA